MLIITILFFIYPILSYKYKECHTCSESISWDKYNLIDASKEHYKQCGMCYEISSEDIEYPKINDLKKLAQKYYEHKVSKWESNVVGVQISKQEDDLSCGFDLITQNYKGKWNYYYSNHITLDKDIDLKFNFVGKRINFTAIEYKNGITSKIDSICFGYNKNLIYNWEQSICITPEILNRCYSLTGDKKFDFTDKRLEFNNGNKHLAAISSHLPPLFLIAFHNLKEKEVGSIINFCYSFDLVYHNKDIEEQCCIKKDEGNAKCFFKDKLDDKFNESPFLFVNGTDKEVISSSKLLKVHFLLLCLSLCFLF